MMDQQSLRPLAGPPSPLRLEMVNGAPCVIRDGGPAEMAFAPSIVSALARRAPIHCRPSAKRLVSGVLGRLRMSEGEGRGQGNAPSRATTTAAHFDHDVAAASLFLAVHKNRLKSVYRKDRVSEKEVVVELRHVLAPSLYAGAGGGNADSIECDRMCYAYMLLFHERLSLL